MNLRHLFSASSLLLALAMGACAVGDEGVRGEPVDPINPEDPAGAEERGQALFTQLCAECHGSEGQGSELAFQVQNPIVNYATFVIRNGRNSVSFPEDMPDYPADEMSDDDLNSILFFLRQAPKPTDGAGLFARFCANCHGADGRGGEVNVNVVEEAQDKPEEVLETVREGEGQSAAQRFDYMPKFSPQDLSDAEVNKITNFLLDQ